MATRGRPRPKQPLAMAGVQARIPAAFAAWLNDQAVEEGTTVSQIIRDAIAAAIVQAGDAERYGIDLVEDET